MINSVGVIGAGIMGHGIAEVFALSGYEVTILDVDENILGKAREKILWSVQHLEKSHKLKESADTVMSRIRTTVDYSELGNSDLILEAVKEDTGIKKAVYENLRKNLKKNTIVASNTSTIPITELGTLYGNGARFIGIHFSNPPVLMPVVEVINGDQTSEETLEESKDFVKSLGKEIVVVRKDVPGFLINRLNDRTILESMTMLEDGNEPGVIDAMTRFRLNFPMGMCELLDFVGIDTVYYANREMVSRGFDSRVSPILKEKVENGELGSKSGCGFYQYEKSGKYSRPTILPDSRMFLLDPLRLLSPAINEAAWLIRNEVCSREDIEKAMKLAMNWPHGPLEYADRYGIDNVVKTLKERLEKTGESRYTPDDLLLKMLEDNELGQRTGSGFSKWTMESKSFGPVVYTLINNYALLEFNRPERLNSLDEGTWKGLKEALDSAQNDDRVRSVVITGRGKAFCAGDDISMMSSWKGKEDADSWMKEFAEPLLDTILSYKKPIISAVNGIAFGGGCELNILFDIVIADKNAVFAIPEGLIGAMPPIATSLGYSLINRKLARYALTGDWFSAEEAMDLGLVDIVVPHGELYSSIAEFTEKVSRIAPLSSRSIKTVIKSMRDIFQKQYEDASGELVKLASTKDFKEGQKAFLSKRAPNWKGE